MLPAVFRLAVAYIAGPGAVIPIGAGAGTAEAAVWAFALLLLRTSRRAHRKAHGTEQQAGENQASHGALPP